MAGVEELLLGIVSFSFTATAPAGEVATSLLAAEGSEAGGDSSKSVFSNI